MLKCKYRLTWIQEGKERKGILSLNKPFMLERFAQALNRRMPARKYRVEKVWIIEEENRKAA